MRADMATEALTRDHEEHLIRCVQAGQEDAFWELTRHYEPMLRRVISQVEGERTEVAQVCQSVFFELVMGFDGGRLGKIKWQLLEKVRHEFNYAGAIATIPDRTYRRYMSILGSAGGNPVTAAVLCQKKGMALATFLRIHALCNAVNAEQVSLEDVAICNDEDTELLAGVALSALESDERRVSVCKWMGSEGVESDATVSYLLAVEDLGLASAARGERYLNTRKVSRVRHTAMEKMREALAA